MTAAGLLAALVAFVAALALAGRCDFPGVVALALVAVVGLGVGAALYGPRRGTPQGIAVGLLSGLGAAVASFALVGYFAFGSCTS